MRYLFFFVHPSKFHVFRNTINELKKRGHHVDLLITSKDVLEDLVKEEGWSYTNIFPEGRKIKGVSPLISSAINFFRTLFRLRKFLYKQKYNLFITDDLLVFFTRLAKVPSVAFTDDDLRVTKQFSIILSQATYILAPSITDLGKFNKKKISFNGYKELAYLHPDVFVPDYKIVEKYVPAGKQYFIIRLVSLKAYHDVGIKGLSNSHVHQLISLLEKYGSVYISSERALPPEFEKYRLQIQPSHISHILAFAKLFIGDSQTMSSEASVLGTFAYRFSDFTGRISVMDEKEERYHLMKSFPTSSFDKMLCDIENKLQQDNLDVTHAQLRQTMIQEKINLTEFMIDLFEELPRRVREIKS